MSAFTEVQAAFGANDETFSACAKFGIIHFSPEIEWIFNDCHLSVSSVRANLERGSIVSLLLQLVRLKW